MDLALATMTRVTMGVNTCDKLSHFRNQPGREPTLSLDTDIVRAVRAAAVGELAWLGPDGRPDALPVTPLLQGERPAVTYPYAYAELARTIAASPRVALVLSDGRMTGRGWQPLAVLARPRLVEDPEGELFTADLVNQELRKYPPSRALADSIMLRREHWWYVPRLVLVLDDESVVAVAERSDPAHQVLAVGAGGLQVDTVRTGEATRDHVDVHSLRDRPAPDGPAALLGHDFSVPDLERWTPWVTRGVLSDGVLRVEERPERTTLEPVPRLRDRLRRQRDLERACRRALGG